MEVSVVQAQTPQKKLRTLSLEVRLYVGSRSLKLHGVQVSEYSNCVH